MSSFAERFIQGFQAGQQVKQQQQALADQAEERSIRKMMLQHELRRLKIDESLQKRRLSQENASMLEGQPESAFPLTNAQTLPTGGPIPFLNVQRDKSVEIQGVDVEGFSVPGVTRQVQSREDLTSAETAAKLRALMFTPQKVGAGESVVLPGTGQVIAQGGPKPKSFQAKEVMVGNQRVQANFDPETGGYFDQQGQPLANVRPAPPETNPLLDEIRKLTITNLQNQVAGGVLTPVQFRMAQALADDYTKASKDYLTRLDSFQTIQTAATNPTAAGDLALIFAYMKMLDPGSTVREGEFANAQNSASVPDRIRNAYNRAMSGERLNPNQRQQFVDEARSQFTQAQTRQRGLIDVYSRRAKAMKLPPEQVVIDYDAAFGVPVTPQPPANSTAPGRNPFR